MSLDDQIETLQGGPQSTFMSWYVFRFCCGKQALLLGLSAHHQYISGFGLKVLVYLRDELFPLMKNIP